MKNLVLISVILLTLTGCSLINRISANLECYDIYKKKDQYFYECVRERLRPKHKIKCRTITDPKDATGLCNQLIP